MVVNPILYPHSLPRVHPYTNFSRHNPGVFVQKVFGQQSSKPLWISHSMALGQKVDCIFLTVCGHDVLVVALLGIIGEYTLLLQFKVSLMILH